MHRPSQCDAASAEPETYFDTDGKRRALSDLAPDSPHTVGRGRRHTFIELAAICLIIWLFRGLSRLWPAGGGRRSSRSPGDGNVHRAGFTLIELLVVIGIISLLVSILLPSLQTAKEMAKRIKCAGNMRAICTGLVMFDTDQGVLPQRFNPVDPNSNWGYDDDLINGGHAERDMFVCPSHDRVAYDRDFKSQPSYGFNWYYDNTSMDRVGMDKVILGEAWGDRDMGCHRVDVADWDREPYKMAVERHRGKANYGFLDGHVKYASFEEISGTDPNFYHQRWGTDQGRHNLLSYWPR